MKTLLKEIAACTVCAEHLELGPRPIISGSVTSKLNIIGQAPGSIVHKTGVPWDDKSGENLRKWLGIAPTTFYDETKVALVPMGFCYPGSGKSGDLPPRTECAPLWHNRVLDELKNVQLTLLVGKYAQDYYLKKNSKRTLTENVRCFEEFLPRYFVLPHPSPRNNIWQARNAWFGEQVLPRLKLEIKKLNI